MKLHNFIFFGSSELSVGVLEALSSQKYLPKIVITNPDKPAGRKLELTESKVSSWVKNTNIQREKNLDEEIILLKPSKLSPYIEHLSTIIEEEEIEFALVASYGKILPEELLNLLPKKVFNIHPSDLPLYRGASPIESQILDGLDNITISIMELVKEMDAGPVWYKEEFPLDLRKENTNNETLELEVGYAGGFTFYKIIQRILSGEITPTIQEESAATFTKKLEKADGDVNEIIKSLQSLNHTAGDKEISVQRHIALEDLYRRYVALTPWPGIFFHFIDKNGQKIRVKINKMIWDKAQESPTITHLTPEGKKAQTLEDFENGFGSLNIFHK